jgi:hypothetical protein
MFEETDMLNLNGYTLYSCNETSHGMPSVYTVSVFLYNILKYI